jgi:hypothetical protein
MLGRRFTSSRIRKERRKQLLIQIGLALAFCLVLLFLAIELVNLKQLRITTIRFEGKSGIAQKELAKAVLPYLEGNYFHLFSKRNMLFVPQKAIRDELLARFVRLESVRVSREGLHTILIKSIERVPQALWCGDGSTTKCYYIDDDARAFALAPAFLGGSFVIYTRTFPQSVLGTLLTPTDIFHDIRAFTDALAPLELSTERVTWSGDSLNLSVRSARNKGTIVRFTIKIPLTPPYGIAVSNLHSILGTTKEGTTFSLEGIEYIDLRFENKVFYKKKEGGVVAPVPVE